MKQRFPKSFQMLRLVFYIPLGISAVSYEKIIDIVGVYGIDECGIDCGHIAVNAYPDSVDELWDIHRQIKKILKKH